jgi:Tfp pilus assembly protein PilO
MEKFDEVKQRYYVEMQCLLGRYEQGLENLYNQENDQAVLKKIAVELCEITKKFDWLTKQCPNMPYVL